VVNSLGLDDITTIVSTLDYFNVNPGLMKQTIYDLGGPPRYRVFDWLGMMLDRSINEKLENDGGNIWVALGNVYRSTSGPKEFVEYLRFMDLELDVGHFSTEAFRAKVRQWNEDELAIRNKEVLSEAKSGFIALRVVFASISLHRYLSFSLSMKSIRTP
jgi:hypothetical protein